MLSSQSKKRTVRFVDLKLSTLFSSRSLDLTQNVMTSPNGIPGDLSSDGRVFNKGRQPAKLAGYSTLTRRLFD